MIYVIISIVGLGSFIIGFILGALATDARHAKDMLESYKINECQEEDGKTTVIDNIYSEGTYN